MTVDEIKDRWESTRLLDHADIETLLDNVVWNAGMVRTLTIENEWLRAEKASARVCDECRGTGDTGCQTGYGYEYDECDDCKGKGIAYGP